MRKTASEIHFFISDAIFCISDLVLLLLQNTCYAFHNKSKRSMKLSFLTDHFFAGILFLSMLFFIKSFTGGIHAGNPVLCYISSCLLFILLSMLAMFFSVFSRPELGSIAFLISITIKPVPCPNKKVSPKLLFRSRLISGINGLIFLLISVLLYINGIDYESSIINLTYLGIAILQVAGKIVYHTGGI